MSKLQNDLSELGQETRQPYKEDKSQNPKQSLSDSLARDQEVRTRLQYDGRRYHPNFTSIQSREKRCQKKRVRLDKKITNEESKK